MKSPKAFVFLLLFTLGGLIWTIESAAQQKRLMLVASRGLPGIAIYDADTDEVICRAKVEDSPHESAFSPDGKYAYVPVYGTASPNNPAGTEGRTVHFIRTSDCKEEGLLDTGEKTRPHGISVGRSGTLYVTAELAQSLLLINPQRRQIIAKIPTDSIYSRTIAVTPDEKKIYVSNVRSKSVSILDVPSRKLLQVVQTGSDVQRVILDPNKRWFVVNLELEHKVAFYRTADNQLDFSVSVEGEPADGMFSADGKYLYIAGVQQKQRVAWKIDVGQRRVIATTEALGKDNGNLVINPFNQMVYVSDTATDRISVIDPASWKVTKRLSTDKTPDSLDFVTVR